MTGAPALTRDRVMQLIKKMKASRIVVIGDIMIDRYLVGDTERVSPEAPVPVVTIRERQAKLGGAANVAANVAALGATCHLVGVVGDDADGAAIRQELAVGRLDDRHVVTVAGRPTTSKTRIIARSQQIVRIDDEVDTLLDGTDLNRLIKVARDALADADALLLEDYNKGALAPALIKAVMEVARQRGIPVVVDPKYRQFFEYRRRHRVQAQPAGAGVGAGRGGRPQRRPRAARGAGPAQGGQPSRDARLRGDVAGDEGRRAHCTSRASRGRSTMCRARATRSRPGWAPRSPPAPRCARRRSWPTTPPASRSASRASRRSHRKSAGGVRGEVRSIGKLRREG